MGEGWARVGSKQIAARTLIYVEVSGARVGSKQTVANKCIDQVKHTWVKVGSKQIDTKLCTTIRGCMGKS